MTYNNYFSINSSNKYIIYIYSKRAGMQSSNIRQNLGESEEDSPGGDSFPEVSNPNPKLQQTLNRFGRTANFYLKEEIYNNEKIREEKAWNDFFSYEEKSIKNKSEDSSPFLKMNNFSSNRSQNKSIRSLSQQRESQQIQQGENDNRNPNLNQSVEQSVDTINQLLCEKMETTKKKKIFKIKKKIFKIKKSIYRQDKYIKRLKVFHIKDYTNQLNKLYKKIRTKRRKILVPDHKLFTQETTQSKNEIFLDKQMRNIFQLGLKKSKNTSFIDQIFKEINIKKETTQQKESLKKLQEMLSMTYEESLMEFLSSEGIERFREEEDIKYFDKNFKLEKGFSLIGGHGFIQLFREFSGYNKKTKTCEDEDKSNEVEDR